MRRPIVGSGHITPIGTSGLANVRMAGSISRRSFSLGLAGAALAGAVGMPGDAFAQKSASVNYMGWQGYDDGLNIDGWFKKNGIDLKSTYIGTNEEIITAAAAGGMGSMGIVTAAEIYLPTYTEAGVLDEISLDVLPNWKGLFPEISSLIPISERNTTLGVPIVWGEYPIVYNADVIKEAPTSWQDLLKPEYKGRVSMVADVMGLLIFAPMAANATRTPTRITQAELDRTIDWLIQIKKEQCRTIAPTYGELGALFATGEVLIAPAWTPTVAWAGKNAPTLKWVIPEEGTGLFVDIFGVIKKAPNRAQIDSILNHSLSPEAQANNANINMTAVTVKDAVPLLSEDARKLYPYDDIGGWFKKAGAPFPPWLVKQAGDHVGYEEIIQGWERFLSA